MTQLKPASTAVAVRTDIPVLRMRLQAAEKALETAVQRVQNRMTEEVRFEDSIQNIGIKDGGLHIQISPNNSLDDGETADGAARYRENLKAICQGHLEEGGFKDFAEIPITVEALPMPKLPPDLKPVVTPPISIGFPTKDSFGAE